MKVFLSWSGERSKAVASALREWLPVVLRDAKPWLSHTDIAPGERWSVELAKELEASDFGIICLTKENLSSPWILFEAGAVAKKMLEGTAVPYLFQVETTELSGPLSQLQAKKADKESTLAIVQAINRRVPVPEDAALVGRRFDALWGQLSDALAAIPPLGPTPPPRPEREMLEELVDAVRSMSNHTEARLLREVMGRELIKLSAKVAGLAAIVEADYRSFEDSYTTRNDERPLAIIGERLAALRERKGLTTIMLAAHAHMPHATLLKIEAESPIISPSARDALASALGISSDTLVELMDPLRDLDIIE